MRLEVAATTEGTDWREFTNDQGWQILLSRLELVAGPVYLLEKKSPVASFFERAHDFLVPQAYAHPGHDFFDGGQVLGEWATVKRFDLIESPSVELGSFTGISGRVQSGTVGLVQPGNEEANAIVEGTASKEGQTVPFRLELSLPADQRRVDFIPADFRLQEGMTVAVQLRPARWFDGVQFEVTTAGSVAVGSQALKAFSLNLRRHVAWTIFGVETEQSERIE